MADFTTPFAQDGERREPTEVEKLNGIPCGGFSRAMFNQLFHRIEDELRTLHAEAGIEGDASTNRTTTDAILALIAAATGGNPAGYILETQALSTIPVFPEVLTTDGRIVITSPSNGTIRIPGGVEFIRRGIKRYTTAQQDLPTAASRIYHLRWDATNGFRLIETGDATYNPTGVAETDPLLDTTFDNMLVARIITNSANIATITNLANKNVIKQSIFRDYLQYPSGAAGTIPETAFSMAKEAIAANFARTPMFVMNGFEESFLSNPSGYDGTETNIRPESLTRYGVTVFAMSVNWMNSTTGRPRYNATLMANG